MAGPHCIRAGLPAFGVVALRARLGLELTLVRIRVTALAPREHDALPLRGRTMAAIARDLDVLAGERIARHAVTERVLVPLLPARGDVALLALCREPALVRILVALRARRRRREVHAATFG